MGIQVFFSYAHRDEDLRDELAKHLSILQRQGVISAWHDRNISGGEEWATEIDRHLATAKIILLLISSDFVASNYCYELEMTQALERHRAGEAVVIPVILRPVDWGGAPFGQLQALPKNALAVTTWPNQDEAFADVARGIRRVAEKLAAADSAEPSEAPKPAATEPQKRAAAVRAPLEVPEGQVRLNSPFYIERPPIEEDCYREILKPSALIRIKAPRQMGKSSLMARILDRARRQGHRTVNLSFQEADGDIFESLEELLRWLCASIAYDLGLPDQLDAYWAGPLAKKQKCSNYLTDHIFPQVQVPLVLGMDEVDQVFQYPKIARDFFGMLRAWHEKKNDPAWQRLRLVITHSKEVYVPLDINQSPFNVGLAIELPEFSALQVQDLAQRHGLSLSPPQLQQLMGLLGGHPFLIRVALYALARGSITLGRFLAIAPTQEGPYQEHLRHHLENLQNHPELQRAMGRVVTARGPVKINDEASFKLKSMGLIRIKGDTVEPLGDLYRRYFCDRIPTAP